MKKKKLKIMFVCTGNICRSPAAHAVLEHKLSERGLADLIEVASSGTTAYHVGEPVDYRMGAELSRHGVRSRNRARQFFPQDLEEYDLLFGMSRSHIREMQRSAVNGYAEYAGRIRLFRDFDPEGTGEVPDPYYGGSEGFTRVYEMVDRTVDGLLDYLERNGYDL